ncbi:uncharacterized protein LOC102699580 [Oryza brachyantha]|uniref:Uncharacterized protein n=1 Tax=Oryza brachyantha TaxID=4533 RepID=J3LVW2_ORYBR|nr:uncharacterized protein LOC102699580 [Oryza brachyantha]
MEKRCSTVLLLGLVLLFSNAIVEVKASQNKIALSRKGLKEERKLAAATGTAPSLGSLQGQSTTSTPNGGVSNNSADSTNADTGDSSSAYTPMGTATSTDSHHDMSVDQYRKIIHNNQMNKP